MHYSENFISLRSGVIPIRIRGRIVQIEIERTCIRVIVSITANRTANPCYLLYRDTQSVSLFAYGKFTLSGKWFTRKRSGATPIRKRGRSVQIEKERTRIRAIASSTANQQISCSRRIVIIILIIC